MDSTSTNSGAYVEAELHVIRKIMQDSRRTIIDNGLHYIFWGVLVTVALILNYLMIIYSYSVNEAGLMWFVLMVSGAVADYFIERRREKARKVKTFAGKVLGSLWGASGLCMFLFGFIGVITKAYNPYFICPIIAVVLGMTYFISGVIQQTNWLRYLTVGWWGGAVYMFLLPGRQTMLVFASMMLLFQVLPGIILYKKWKKEENRGFEV